jgi:hypothetical protein
MDAQQQALDYVISTNGSYTGPGVDPFVQRAFALPTYYVFSRSYASDDPNLDFWTITWQGWYATQQKTGVQQINPRRTNVPPVAVRNSAYFIDDDGTVFTGQRGPSGGEITIAPDGTKYESFRPGWNDSIVSTAPFRAVSSVLNPIVDTAGNVKDAIGNVGNDAVSAINDWSKSISSFSSPTNVSLLALAAVVVVLLVVMSSKK